MIQKTAMARPFQRLMRLAAEQHLRFLQHHGGEMTC